jgi:hypothetical protein
MKLRNPGRAALRANGSKRPVWFDTSITFLFEGRFSMPDTDGVRQKAARPALTNSLKNILNDRLRPNIRENGKAKRGTRAKNKIMYAQRSAE